MRNLKRKITVTLQTAIKKPANLPNTRTFRKWILIVLNNKSLFLDDFGAEITIRIVDKKESAFLNLKYRKKTGPTNILSFYYDSPENLFNSKFLYGDLVICWSIAKLEALEQNKSLNAHLSHLVVHGVLHLLGYDHHKSKDAKIMENLENKLLQQIVNF